MGQPIKNRQHEKREQRGRKNSANHHGGQRTLDFSASASSDGHGNEAQRGHQGSHQHGAQAGQSALADRLVKAYTAFSQASDVGNHHQPVENGHPRQRNEPYGRRNRHRNVAKPKRQDAARQREWNTGEDQQSILDVSEHREQKDEDQQQGHGHNDL